MLLLCRPGGHPGAGLRAGVGARRGRADRPRSGRARRRVRPTSSCRRATVVPGFVDAHVHGGGGASFDGGDPEAARDGGPRPPRPRHDHDDGQPGHRRARTRWRDSVARLAALVDDGLLAGIHLEGPWLSPRYAGAHDPDLLTDPEPRAGRRAARRGPRARPDGDAGPRAGRRPGRDPAAHRGRRGRPRSATPTRRTTWPGRRSTPAPASAPTCSTRCAGCTTASPGRSPRCSSTRTPTSSWSPTACTCTRRCSGSRPRAKPHLTVLVTDAMAAAAAADGDYRLGPLDGRGARRRGPAGRHRRDRRVDADHGGRACGTPSRSPGCRSRTSSARPPPRRPRCSAWTGSVRCAPGFDADLVVLDDDLAVQRVMRKGAWVG